MIFMMSSFSKSCFQNVFATLKCKAGVFKFFQFEEQFKKALFS